jgi:hypothetical protein
MSVADLHGVFSPSEDAIHLPSEKAHSWIPACAGMMIKSNFSPVPLASNVGFRMNTN